VSFDHWWIGLFVDEVGYDLLKPDFVAAAERAVLSAQSHQAIAAWRNRPADFEQGASPPSPEAEDEPNTFIWAFNLPGFDELAKQFCVEGGKFTEFLVEEDFFRMAVCGRHTPVSILWHALGYERASLLPGQMGNLLLHPREIEQARVKTRRAYAQTSPQDLLDAARRYCSWSVDDDRLREVIGFLPDGLARAAELQRGFLALARPQI
jgi:hypothetical protein